MVMPSRNAARPSGRLSLERYQNDSAKALLPSPRHLFSHWRIGQTTLPHVDGCANATRPLFATIQPVVTSSNWFWGYTFPRGPNPIFRHGYPTTHSISVRQAACDDDSIWWATYSSKHSSWRSVCCAALRRGHSRNRDPVGTRSRSLDRQHPQCFCQLPRRSPARPLHLPPLARRLLSMA